MAAAGNSRFAFTCMRLRQYMRNRKQQDPQQLMADLRGAFQVPPPLVATEAAEEADDRTMQLFPVGPGMAQPSQEQPEAQAKEPLTIIYQGQVLVFDNLPADKADELIEIAGSWSAPLAPEKGAPDMPEKPVDVEPPIARKASLQRFLRKRKHRISGAGPDHNVADGKLPVDDDDEPAAASWLRL